MKNKGFTLIELLIVIAILGVLAVVVLVAINPVQQLARTRDAGRTSSVAQLGHAVEAYYASHNGTYPTDLTDLTDAGELNEIPSAVTRSTGNGPSCSAGEISGWCYDAGTTAFAIYTGYEADTNIEQCGAAGTAFAAYLSATGKTCLHCGTPDNTSTGANCQN